jgi:hypothetical protein
VTMLVMWIAENPPLDGWMDGWMDGLRMGDPSRGNQSCRVWLLSLPAKGSTMGRGPPPRRLRKSLKDFGLPVPVLPIFTDNQASLSLLEHGAVSPVTKHIDVIYHVVRDSLLNGDIIFSYISTEMMVVDFLTKALPLPKLRYCLGAIGMHPTVYAAAKSLSPCSGFGLGSYRGSTVFLWQCVVWPLFLLFWSSSSHTYLRDQETYKTPVCILHSKSGGQLSPCISSTGLNIFLFS